MRVPSAFLTIITAGMLAGCGASGAPATSAPASPNASQASAAPTSAQPASAGAAASAKPAASAAPAGSSPASAGTKVRGAWVAIAATQSPLWAARDGGYFAKHGLEADNTLIRGSGTAIAALISQNVDIVQMSGPATVNGVVQGADLTMIAGFVNTATYKLMADPAIKTLNDLKGKTVAVSQIGGQDDFILRKAMKLKGVADTDLKIVATKDIPSSVAALNSHTVQAAILADPEHIPALKAGAHELLDITGMNIPFAATGLVTTHAYLKAHSDVTVQFTEAMIDAIRRIKSDRAFTDSVMSKGLSTTDPDVLQSAWGIASTAFAEKPYPSLTGIQEVMDENDVKGHKPEDFVDSSIVKQIDDSGYFQQR